MNNSFGDLFRITVFGESHGRCVGVVVDGCPAGLPLTLEDIQKEVDKRKPAAEAGQTSRSEADRVEILSGVFEDYTTGAPVCLLVWNQDTDSSEYERIRMTPRPGHADYTAFMKFGGYNDYRGGGRFSGRVTVALVMAGAIAKKLIAIPGMEVLTHTIQIGEIIAEAKNPEEIRRNVYQNPMRCADPAAAKAMAKMVEQVSREGDSVGGVIEGRVLNMPVGLGEPYFNTLEGQLAKALLAIPAVKGVEFGAGFSTAGKKGSENNDPFILKEGRVETTTNQSGGILGGISNGMPLILRIAVKPAPSIFQNQRTIDLQKLENTELNIKGRHDACIVPRAVIVVESMVAVTLCDLAMQAGIIQRIVK
jgi:chorismate synthase